MVSELSGEEAKALVQALIVAETTVEAWYVGNGIDTAVLGVMRLNPDGQYCVSQTVTSGPHISIDPKLFAAGKYSDKSSIPDFSPHGVLTSSMEFSSALMFKLKDGSLFTLFEVAKVN